MPSPANATYRALVTARRTATLLAVIFLVSSLLLTVVALADEAPVTEVPMLSVGSTGQAVAGLALLFVRWLINRCIRWHAIERAASGRR